MILLPLCVIVVEMKIFYTTTLWELLYLLYMDAGKHFIVKLVFFSRQYPPNVMYVIILFRNIYIFTFCLSRMGVIYFYYFQTKFFYWILISLMKNYIFCTKYKLDHTDTYCASVAYSLGNIFLRSFRSYITFVWV